MVHRLIETLRALAAPADMQLAPFPDFVVRADELARDFDDALLLVRDCPQLLLTRRQQDALAEVDWAVNAVHGQGRQLFTDDAVRTSAEWDEVRRCAREALDALDAAQPPATDGRGLHGRP